MVSDDGNAPDILSPGFALELEKRALSSEKNGTYPYPGHMSRM
ncbi:hypothetical protein ACOZ38_08270 [Sphaerisporangium viridialbum]